jgi:LysR family glycine cleavage system transcriptional activator
LAYRLPSLPWLRAFEAAARHSSFSAAASELNLTPAAVSHQVRSLEQHLGQTIFERMPRGVRLTEIGKAYLPSVRKAFDELSVSTIGIFGAGSGATVSLRTPISFGALRLAPRLHRFRAEHPEIHLRLNAAVWADAVGLDGIDLDIRFGDGRWPEVDAVSLGPETSILVCSAAFARQGAAAGVMALARRGVIAIMGSEDLWANLLQQAGGGVEQSNEVVKVDNSLTGLELAQSGVGCLLVLRSLATPLLETGRLIEPLPGLGLKHDRSHFILVPKRNEQSRPEATLLRSWLLQHLRTDAAGATEEAGASRASRVKPESGDSLGA